MNSQQRVAYVINFAQQASQILKACSCRVEENILAAMIQLQNSDGATADTICEWLEVKSFSKNFEPAGNTPGQINHSIASHSIL